MRGNTRLVAMFAALIFLLASDSITAKSLYRCENGNAVSYQDRPCERSDTQERVDEITVEPPVEQVSSSGHPTSVSSVARPPVRQTPRPSFVPPAPVREEPQSFRCVASNGEVFYRHDRCPSAVNHGTYTTSRYDRYTGNHVFTSTPTYDEVTSELVSRKEACKAMNSIAGRSRRERNKDGAANTYERNLGRDPCR